MVSDESFQCILLEQWIKLNISSYLGTGTHVMGTRTHLPVPGILAKSLIFGTIQQKDYVKFPMHMILPRRYSLKLVDGDKATVFLRIDSIQLNGNSERPGNEAENFVN